MLTNVDIIDIDSFGSDSGSRLTLKLNKTTNLPKFANLFERISNHYELRLINSSETTVNSPSCAAYTFPLNETVSNTIQEHVKSNFLIIIFILFSDENLTHLGS